MPTTRRFSLFPLFTLVGLMACSGSNSAGPQGGASGTQSSTEPLGGSATTAGAGPTAGTPTGGNTSPAGGTTVPVTTSAAGGTTVPVTTSVAGGTTVPVTSSAAGTMAAGGSTRPGGTTAAGGSAAGGRAGGSTSAGGTTGGRGGTAGATGPAGASGSAGSTGTAGISGSAGSSGGGAAGGTPAPGSIPAGYPTPTADNYAKCKSSTVSSGLCPGGGAGPVCIECHFGGAAGDYAVTVTLGGAAASQTYVSAEANRGLLAPVTINPGQSLTYAFVVDVRTKESEPAEAVSAGTPGLDMYFSGPTATPPAVSAIGYALVTAATKPTMVYIASDSTACDQPGSGFGGWGQMLPEYFAPPIGIANYADSGESSSSFYGNSLLWGAIKSHWTAGDWVLIQFGHNDKGVADSVVETNLEKYVTDAQAAKVNAILISPPARVSSIPIGDQSSLHAVSAATAATNKGVPYIDLTALSTAWYNGLGMTKTEVLAAYHAGGTDATHTSIPGAEKLAGLVAGEIKTQKIAGLVEYLR
jgi:lysophospholipase L1-like esterase